jgi:eukaryotic-like serine/threonine-protein kinase
VCEDQGPPPSAPDAKVSSAGDRERVAERVGDYVLREKIGEGGMGEIYLATHAQTGMLVAVKFARAAVLATPEGAALFRNEINTTSRLDHPNIARVFPSTQETGLRYFVMQLFEGGTLQDRQNWARHRTPRLAVELMLQIAAGVQHAHAHGVLHCDLKPSNILFDTEGVPHVSDFGLARILEGVGITPSPALPGGTPGWQSPEQAAGQTGSATSDVFQLGVMLHWLVEGELPRPSDDGPARLPWAPNLECAVEDICRSALAGRPEARYQTVAQFADDLEHALGNLPLRDEADRPLRRLVRWAHRQKLVAALLVSFACLLAALPFVLDSVLVQARGWIRQQNQFAARAQALAVRNQLQVDAASLEKAALDQQVHALLGSHDPSRAPPALVRYQAGFDSLFVYSPNGDFEARSPLPQPFDADANYLFRDYHRCAIALGRRLVNVAAQASAGIPVCVSRVFRSSVDDNLKVSLGAPLIDEGRVTGVITGSIQARDRFGGLEMRCGPGQCMTALLGPRDHDDAHAALPQTLVVLAHPSLKLPWVNPTDPKDERHLDAASVKRICRELRCEADLAEPFGDPEHAPIIVDDLEEPVTRQHSVVALAPIGRTGLIVMVATPDAAVQEIRSAVRWTAWLFLWIPPLAGLSLLACVLLGPQLLRAQAVRR